MAQLVSADCFDKFEGSVIALEVQSCEAIAPDTTAQLRDYTGSTLGERRQFLERYYRGALITTKEGTRYVYPDRQSNPCQQFLPGKLVKKAATYTCCDTGAWGKCIFGGAFLYDPGSKPVNSFQ